MWVRKQIRTLAFCGGWERRSGGTRKSSTVNIGGSKKYSILIEGMTWMLRCCNKNYPHLPPLPPPSGDKSWAVFNNWNEFYISVNEHVPPLDINTLPALLLGLFRRKKRRVRGYARKVSSYWFHVLCKGDLVLKGVKSQEVSKNGSQFLLCLADFFAFINSVWAL